jgi:hypothetical protein
MDTFQAVPSVRAIEMAIMDITQERLVMTPDELQDKRLATAAAIHSEYSWDSLVKDQWQPFLQRVLSDVNAA